MFTAELREAIADDRVDIAVHSYKDLPTAVDPRLAVPATPARVDPRDALVARDGLVLGSCRSARCWAPRRCAGPRSLEHWVSVWKSAPTRQPRYQVEQGKQRRTRRHRGCPSGAHPHRAGGCDHRDAGAGTDAAGPGSGALALECRAGDTELIELLAKLNDADTHAAVTAERILLAELEAGCSAPVGAIAEVVESIDEDGNVFEELSLRACVAAVDGSDVIRASGIGSPERAAELGRSVAAELFELGARELMAASR